jgi:hypothetical protein
MLMLSSSVLRLSLTCAAAVFVAACNGNGVDQAKYGATPATSAAPADAKLEYPEPRFPSYLKPPKSTDDLMPYARNLARNKSGVQGKGMGILEPGESVLIVANEVAEEIVLEAIRKALEERKVTAHIKRTYDMTGVTKDKALALSKSLRDG